jgi:hypothetical protein
VAYADLRTSMNDYRVLLSQAVGQECDRNGFKSHPAVSSVSDAMPAATMPVDDVPAAKVSVHTVTVQGMLL